MPTCRMGCSSAPRLDLRGGIFKVSPHLEAEVVVVPRQEAEAVVVPRQEAEAGVEADLEAEAGGGVRLGTAPRSRQTLQHPAMGRRASA
jgi:hypothetical protein